jgi:hypothetical protein
MVSYHFKQIKAVLSQNILQNEEADKQTFDYQPGTFLTACICTGERQTSCTDKRWNGLAERF